MTIKHIVINGGGPNMWYMYGALKHLHEKSIWNLENIESVYATSAGALLFTILVLINDWDDIDNFLINCTWDKYIDTSLDKFLLLFDKKGIYDIKIYEQILKPLLEMNNLSIDVSFSDFCKKYDKNFFFYCSNLNTFTHACISNTTHPDIKFLLALQMTSAVPPIVEPVTYNGEIYFDGALFYNYPLKPCYDCDGVNPDEILALKNMENSTGKVEINDNDNFFSYMSHIFKKFINRSDNMHIQPKIKNEVHLMFQSTVNYEYWTNILSNKNYREKIKQDGINCAKLFILYNNNQNNQNN